MRNPELGAAQEALQAEAEDLRSKITVLEASPEGHEEELSKLHARHDEIQQQLKEFEHTDQQAA